MPRVAAIALDAAEIDVLDDLIDRGEVPALGALRDRSARYRLRSDSLYRGTLVWEAFLAGRDDVGHSTGGGFSFASDSYTCFEGGPPGTTPFYERAPGIGAIPLAVPHRAPSARGVRVPGWGG